MLYYNSKNVKGVEESFSIMKGCKFLYKCLQSTAQGTINSR